MKMTLFKKVKWQIENIRHHYLRERDIRKRIRIEFEKGYKYYTSVNETGCFPDNEYIAMCFKSAHRAYLAAEKSIAMDYHSGMSHAITMDIFTKAMNGIPLSPFTSDPDEWERYDLLLDDDIEEAYRNVRDGAVTCTKKDGKYIVHDVERVTVKHDNSDVYWYSGFVDKIIGELEPIRFPYTREKIVVTCEEGLFDPHNGDFDTLLIKGYKKGDEYKEVNLAFKEDEENGGWASINMAEYSHRKAHWESRISHSPINADANMGTICGNPDRYE